MILNDFFSHSFPFPPFPPCSEICKDYAKIPSHPPQQTFFIATELDNPKSSWIHSSLTNFFRWIRQKIAFRSASNLVRKSAMKLPICFYSCFSSMMSNHSFVWIAPFIWLYWNAEPSSFFKRALACASPSPRLNANEPSPTCWILKNAWLFLI